MSAEIKVPRGAGYGWGGGGGGEGGAWDRKARCNTGAGFFPL